jgi:hypothetical protein
MESICSSETSVDSQRTTQRYVPEGSALHNHRCENLKSYKLIVSLVFCIYLRYRLTSTFIELSSLPTILACHILSSSPPLSLTVQTAFVPLVMLGRAPAPEEIRSSVYNVSRSSEKRRA